MRLLTILWEDHTAEGFRPLAWSRPVHEIPCGILTARQRVAALLARRRERGVAAPGGGAGPPDLGLLARPHLEAAHRPAGAATGPEAVGAALADRDRALWLSGRIGPRWDLLEFLRERAEAGRDFAWSDGHGLLACSCAAAVAADLLDDWRRWREEGRAAGCWSRPDRRPPRWAARAAATLPGLRPPPPADAEGPAPPAALGFLWEVVPALGAAIAADAAALSAWGGAVARDPSGVVPAADADAGAGAPWRRPLRLRRAAEAGPGAVHPSAVLLAERRIWLGEGATVGPLTVVDATAGPVVLESGAAVEPLCHLRGPLAVGPGALVKAGCRLGPEVVVGAAGKVAGEVAESQLCDFVNKQHDGFLGHAVVGSWVNLGAGTTGSDLKNNYGPVRVDLGLGAVDTGLRFLGPLIGEHAKTAIGTVLNTGAVVGFACNVFGPGFPPKLLPAFTWGNDPSVAHDVERALATARAACARRGVAVGPEQEALFRHLAAAAR